MSAASEKDLEALHQALTNELRRRIEEGTASAADLSAAAKLLKDNNITAVRTPDSPLDNLAKSLPFPTEDGVLHEQETQH